ncbi:MAG: hypothetical protein GY857_14500 [Desulfobacula sp.]|nr:hypothetical protein [Desulfobacula sp.]
MTQYKDRRKHQRLLANGGTLVMTGKPRFLNLGKPRFFKFGPVINISKGGISIQYISSKKRPNKYTELSITMPAEDLKLDNISFETVTDFQKTEFLKSKKIRQRCIKFHNLTESQMFQVDYFLDNHTNGLAMDRRSKQDRRKSNLPRFSESQGLNKDRRNQGERRRY